LVCTHCYQLHIKNQSGEAESTFSAAVSERRLKLAEDGEHAWDEKPHDNEGEAVRDNVEVKREVDEAFVADDEDDDSSESESASESEDDFEGSKSHRSHFAGQQAREDILETMDEEMFFKSEETAELVSQKQLIDETDPLLYLPAGKIWTNNDLDDEEYLKIGLQLLYNKIQGKKTLDFGISIYINYKEFPLDVMETMKANREISHRQKRAVKAFDA
jgi:hypothetical protein